MTRTPSVSAPALALAFALLASLPGALGAQAAPKPEARDLVVLFNELDVQYDPHHSIYASEAQIFTAIYEGLFSYEPASLEPVKAACSSWTKSKDSLTYSFTIRSDAVWSDGSPLRAADFRNAWLRALAPAEKADYASFFDVIAGAKDYRLGKTKDASKVGVAVKGERVLEVRLAAPASYFTRLLCHHAFSPIHPSMLAAHDWKQRATFPVNGPFMIGTKGSAEIHLVKNPTYWDAASVKLPGIRILLSDDDNEATRLYDNGEADWLAGPMNLDNLLSRDAISAVPMFATQYWFFDCSTAPFDSSKLRRALALLLPWDQIRSKDSYLSPAETLVLPLDGYEEAKGITARDEAEATRLLEESGHAGGKGVPTITIAIPAGSDDAVRVTKIMKENWEQAGFNVEIRAVPSGRYSETVRRSPGRQAITLALSTWIGDFADPLAFLQMWESDSNLNDAAYRDPEYDRLLADSSLIEGRPRLSALAKAETRLLQDGVCLPLYHSIALNVVDPQSVPGWTENALDIHPFKYLSIGESRIRPGVVAAPEAEGGRS